MSNNVLITGDLVFTKTSDQIQFISGADSLTVNANVQTGNYNITIPDAGEDANVVVSTGGELTITNTPSASYVLTGIDSSSASFQVAPSAGTIVPTSFGYTYTLNSVASTTLTASGSTYYQHFGGTNDSNAVTLPGVGFGTSFCFMHDGSGILTIKNSSGTTFTTMTGTTSKTIIGDNLGVNILITSV